MSEKIGEARLGSVQFSTPEPFIPDERPARERAEEHMKSAFPTHDGTVWDKLLRLVLHDAEFQNEVVGDIIDERFVDTASRKQLGMIGEYFGLERRADESDDHFRARIKSQLPRMTTTTTIDELVRVTTQLLETDPERVSVSEDFEIEPARFNIQVEAIAFRDTDISVDEFTDLIQDVRAAGVQAFAFVGEQFTHRSVSDFEEGVNNLDRGYGGIDSDYIEERDGEANRVTSPDYELQLDATETPLGGVYADEVSAITIN